MEPIENAAFCPNAQHIMLILNPTAGRGQAPRYRSEAPHAFKSAGYRVAFFVTEKSGDASRFVDEYGADFYMIVCLGGDGTFNEVCCMHWKIRIIPAIVLTFFIPTSLLLNREAYRMVAGRRICLRRSNVQVEKIHRFLTLAANE